MGREGRREREVEPRGRQASHSSGFFSGPSAFRNQFLSMQLGYGTRWAWPTLMCPFNYESPGNMAPRLALFHRKPQLMCLAGQPVGDTMNIQASMGRPPSYQGPFSWKLWHGATVKSNALCKLCGNYVRAKLSFSGSSVKNTTLSPHNSIHVFPTIA